jgi:hypothetical protein
MLHYLQQKAVIYINVLVLNNFKKSISYSCKSFATAERNIKSKFCIKTCNPVDNMYGYRVVADIQNVWMSQQKFVSRLMRLGSIPQIKKQLCSENM